MTITADPRSYLPVLDGVRVTGMVQKGKAGINCAANWLHGEGLILLDDGRHDGVDIELEDLQ